MGQTHQREAAIFDAAIELPPAQRATHLDQACGNDPALRQRIEALLKAGDSACEFLDPPAELAEVKPDRAPIVETAGSRIGRYTLLQQIGEGGCGVVYMAEQEEPVRRRVAIKIIKVGLDTKSVVARFEAERQALAMMEHPNIAKVFDAGATETGRPYFVMELVRGLKITDYCDEAKLSTRARLDLFIQVCHAIQHAHQKGIIHRDIKPSNILVTINDGVPVPKVIDFGIAKATSGQKLTDKLVFTAFEQFIGTPAYMSPEQAMLTSLDIDTRSDIYALGVLLYEMLTGKTPFDPKELLAIGLDEMRRTIREQEPPRPSTRLSTMPGNDLSTLAQRRGLEAPKLVTELRGDLDWIIMKALEKDRARRYETANGLAMDIQRHLRNEPVAACPPSGLYRFEKMVRRNKLAVGSAFAVASALVIGSGISTWMFLREREARKRAVAAEQAERKLRQEAELREINLRAFEAATQLANIDNPEPIITRQQALETQRQRLGNDHLDVATSLEELSRIFLRMKKFPESAAAAREAIGIFKKNFPNGDFSTAKCLHRLAYVFSEQNKHKEAEEPLREALEILSVVRGANDNETAVVKYHLGLAIWNQNRLADAEPLIREAFEVIRKNRSGAGKLLVLVGQNRIRLLLNLGKASEAAALAREFVPANVNVTDVAGPSLPQLAGEVARGLDRQGKLQEAEELLATLISEIPNSAALIFARALLMVEHDRFEEAVNDYRKVIDLDRDEHWRVYELCALLAFIGNKSLHCEYGALYFQRFKQSPDWNVLERGIKSALLLPGSDENTRLAIQLADSLPAAALQSSNGSWHALAKGLAQYRDGKMESCLNYLRQAAEEKRTPSCRAQALTISAMAHYQLGQKEEAESEFATARELERSKQGDQWHDWLRVTVFLREAEAVMEKEKAKSVSDQ